MLCITVLTSSSYNNLKALDQQGIEIRNSSGVNIGGFYLS
jgi:hypothetical protein